MAHIELTDVTVRYPIYASSRQRSILGFAANRASFGRIARDAGRIPVVDALMGVSLSLKEGDRLALIGRNGSGKTTLLKVCAGLIIPDTGSVVVEGTRASILHPASALDHEKTGAENVEMIGRLLGVPHHRRAALLKDVEDFTELGEFLTVPIRTYSAGMLVRLSFALATSIERDVLIVDEAIGAGDAHFVSKASDRVRALFNRAKILVLATHAGEIGARLCTSAAWVQSGKIVMTGEPKSVWQAYLDKSSGGDVEAAA